MKPAMVLLLVIIIGAGAIITTVKYLLRDDKKWQSRNK